MADYDFDEESYLASVLRKPLPMPVQAVPERPNAWRRVPDIGVTALKGAVGLPEALVGLADIPTGGAAGRGIERAGVRFGETQKILSEMYSPQQKAAQAAVSEGFREGFLPGISAAIQHPSTIATTIGESVPSMLGGAAAARGLLKVAPKMAPWAAGAVGEGLVGMGSAAEQIRQQSPTGYLAPKQVLSAVGSGLGTAAFGAVGGKLASKYGLGDVETALARGSVGTSDKGFIRRVVESGLSEGVLEELPQSIQEQMWQNYATNRPLTEGVGEAAGMGMLAGVGMGATVGALTKRRDLTKPAAPLAEPAPPADLATGLFPEAQPTPGAGINRDRYMALRKLGADHNLALQNSLLTGEHGALMDEALQQVAPATYRKDIEKQISKAGGDIETATVAALSTEDAKQNYVYLRKLGMPRAAAIKQAVDMPPVGSEQQGMLFAAEGAKPKRVKVIKGERAKTMAVVPQEKLAKPKRMSPIEEAQARVDAAFEVGTPEHIDLSNTLATAGDSKKARLKALKEVQNALQKRSAAQEVSPVGEAGQVVTVGREGVGPVVEGAEVAQAGEAQKDALIAFENKLPDQQRKIFTLLRTAAEAGDLDKYVGADGAFQAEAISKELGLGARGKVSTTLSRLRIKLDTAAGRDVKAALAATVAAKRATEVSDYERLGLSPALQAVTASEAEYLGGEGVEPTMGIISSAGGSQGATSADVTGPLPQKERLIETEARKIIREGGEQMPEIVAGVPNEAAIAAAKQAKITAIVEGLRTGDLADAIYAWNDIATKIDGLEPIPADLSSIEMNDQTLDALNEVLGAYQQVMEDESLATEARRSFDTEGAYESAFRDIVRTRTVNAAKLDADARTAEGRVLSAEPEVGAVAEPVGEKPVRAVKVEVKKRRVAQPPITLSETATVENPHTKKSLLNFIEGLFRSSERMGKVVKVYQTQAEAVAANAQLSEAKGKIAGFKTADGKVGLIAEHIEQGSELGVVLHEIGVHLGMEKLVGKANMKWLTDRVRAWAKLGDGSKQNLAAIDALRRAEKSSSTNKEEEILAYVVEELVTTHGVNPQAFGTSTVHQWFRRMFAAMKVALRKIGFKRLDFSGQNLIDLAYGAAELEMNRPSGEVVVTRIKGAVPADIQFSEASIVSAVREMGEQRGVGTEAVKYAAMTPFTRDLTKWASKYMKSASGFWDALNARLEDTTKWSLATEKVLQQFLDLSNKSVGNALSSQDKVQKFLFDGKMDGTWGFQPEWIKESVPISAAMKLKWAALSQSERDAAKAVLKLFNELRKADIAAVRASVENFRKYADTLKDPETKKDIEDDVALKLKQMKTLAEYRGPYVPTMRFGDYAVEAKSKAFLDAEANNDTAAMAKMKSDEKNYFYAQFKTQREANAAKAKIDGDFRDGFVQARPKFGHPTGKKADFSALIKIEGLMRKYTDKKGASEVRSLLNTLMSDLSEEYSEVQSRQMFKAVSGAQWNEVMQGVAIRGKQMAFKIAALNHNRTISNKLFDMRDEANKSPDSTTAIHLWNEMEKRHTNSMDGEEINESVQNIMGAVSFWKLLTNPMYYVTQLMQPYQYSIPSMIKAGLGYTDSWKAMWDAKESVLEVFKQSKMVKSVAEDLSWAGKAHGKDVQEMLEWLQARNLLDMGINSEVGALEGAHIIKQKIERHAIRPLRNAVQNVELINRITTAIATYQLALKKTGSKEQARLITENVIADSHGLYAGVNAPRYLNQKDWRRIPVQFRKFQLIQATFLYRNLVQELGKIKNPTERAAAMRTIATTLSHTLVVAGLKGSVLWLVVSSLMSLAGMGDDEDDPRTNEEKAFTYLSNEYSPGFANFVMHGAPTAVGVDISARAAMNPLTVLPFDNQSLFSALSSKKAFQESAYTLAGGAFGGFAGDMVDGFDLMREGNWYKGAEKVLPLGFKNVLQAARYGSEGISQRNGIVTMAPEELDWWDITQQALGAPPEVVKSAQRKRTQLHDTMEAFVERQKELKLDYQQARDDGDVEAMQNVRREWTKMIGTMRGLGIKPPKITSLTKKQEPDVVGGVTVTKQTRRYLESMG